MLSLTAQWLDKDFNWSGLFWLRGTHPAAGCPRRGSEPAQHLGCGDNRPKDPLPTHALATYAADYDFPETLTAHQWGLVENLITLLSLFERHRLLIPSVRALRRFLSKEPDTDHCVKTTKTALLEAVNKHFDQMEYDPFFCIATSLDPKYKDGHFDEDVLEQMACRFLHGQSAAVQLYVIFFFLSLI